MKIEICLESVESVIAAERGGADRIEFCADLFEGGITPSLGAFKTAQKHTTLPMMVMIRPRGGDFCYSDLEFEAMKEDARLFRDAGAEGLVFGILKPNGEVDVERSRQIIEFARPCQVTFHRAFDMTPDPFAALETLIDLGVERILTSGQEATAMEGVLTLRKLVERAGDRIIIMPASEINERNFTYLQEQIGAKEYHLFLPEAVESKMQFRPGHIYMGGLLRQPEFDLFHTSEERVQTAVALKANKK